jgi:hypothetical protein
MIAKHCWKYLPASLGLIVLFALSSELRSQAKPSASITVLTPSGAPSDTIPEGEDYFNLELGDPRDMNQRLDLRYQYPDVTNISVQDGLWTGYGSNYVFPLFPGISGAANIGQTGQDFPIDGDRFTRFSVRAQSSASGAVSLYYYTGPFTGGGWMGSGSLVAGEMHTFQWDTTWSGDVAGLRLSISGNPFVVDWIRLTEPAASPVYAITWAATDVSWVNIYCDTDTDPSVLDHQIASWVDADDGSYIWETGYLASDTYYVYIEDTQNPSTAAYSAGPLTIKPMPVLDITAPSRTSGDDYATVEIGNSWDMSDSADVAFQSHLASVSFDGIMHATTSGGDPYLHLSSAGRDTIETDYYKYLTWRFYVEGDWADSWKRLGGDPDDRWGVSRVYADATGPWSTYSDVIPWEGWHVYQMDLSRSGGKYYLDDTTSSDPGWNGPASTIRLDILEPYAEDRWPIHLDYVLLTADPRPSGDQYVIQWQVVQGEPITTTLYYTTDPDTDACDNGGTFIGQFALSDPAPPTGPYQVYLPLMMSSEVAPSGNAYAWNSLPSTPDEYYVQILADDGLNRTCWTSTAPLVIDP